MSLKDKLKAKSAGVRAEVDAEMAIGSTDQKPVHPRTAIGQASAFQLAMAERDNRIAELEANLVYSGSSMLPMDSISPNPWQPRRVFGEEEIRSLAESIAEVGLIQPIVVRKSVPSRDTSKGDQTDFRSVPSRDTSYQLVAGERRWRAHQVLGHAEIKAVIADASDEDMALMALAENLDREDLTDFETSKAIRRVESEFKSKTRLAEAIGIGRQDLYKYGAFAKLPKLITDDLELNPGILGRNAAERLVIAINADGPKALEALPEIWRKVKNGHLDQGKMADVLKAELTQGKTVRTDRDIKKLFIGKEQAGSITRDAAALTIKIRTAALSIEKEDRLRAFVQQVLLDPD